MCKDASASALALWDASNGFLLVCLSLTAGSFNGRSLPALGPFVVEGEELHPEDFSEDSGWHLASQRRPSPKSSQAGQDAAVAGANHRTGANATSEQSERTKNGASIKNRIIRRSRMPPLPREDIKIVLRIRGGLNISKVGPTMVADAVTTAACIETSKRELDTICPNFQQNIIVVSTPEEENATKYVRIRSILVAGRMHEVAAYRTAPYATCKGIIKDIPRCDGPEVLQRKIVNSRNPLALAAKRIKETGTVIVAFDGYRVPNYVRYENALVRCTLYRKQIDICYVCGRLGHRADVCPSPSEAICRGCGASSPDEEHQCTPKCKLKECKQRFQIHTSFDAVDENEPEPKEAVQEALRLTNATGMPLMLDKPALMDDQTRNAVPARGGAVVPDHDPGADVVPEAPPSVTPKVVLKGDPPPRFVFESRSHSRSRSRSKGRQLHQQSSAAYKGDLSSWADRVRGGPIEVTFGFCCSSRTAAWIIGARTPPRAPMIQAAVVVETCVLLRNADADRPGKRRVNVLLKGSAGAGVAACNPLMKALE
ncbi:hypothetical protein HPB52_000758 [Rhipicephalus sanguineus]|uniref:CCHC-type domain-containing protein n=1 Tax=Rhipicephalus sanguineus TaxID=34632 RepID=A0A9D4SPV6_RHISA|nr:hypothetical protein HPB52_000758 [Rhipicephalus sanguineus]